MKPKLSPTREMPANERIIGIIGGVGPEAGTLLHRYIIQETQEVTRDQDHSIVIHYSASPWITDRTGYLLDQHSENPATGAFKVAQLLSSTADQLRRDCVAGVPCNTFHAKPIFDELKKLLAQHQIGNVEILHMIEETKKYITKNFPDISKIGLMSTTGTRNQRIYHDLLEQEVVEVDPQMQDELHNTIYDPQYGIKSVSPVSAEARNHFQKYAKILQEQGAEAIILGCTEIPLALPGKDFNGIPLIDPMRALAKSLAKKSNRLI